MTDSGIYSSTRQRTINRAKQATVSCFHPTILPCRLISSLPRGLPVQTCHYFDYSSVVANHRCRSCRCLTTNHYFFFPISSLLSGLYSPSLSTSVLKQDEWKRIDMNAFSVGSYFWPFVHLNYFCKLNQKNNIRVLFEFRRKKITFYQRIQFWLINLISGYPIAEEFKRMNFKLLYRFGEIGIYNFAG